MKTAQNNSKFSIALVFGMVCASVLMLTGNAVGASHHVAQAPQAVPANANDASMVTGIQTVVITGKRASAAEIAEYRRQLAAVSAPRA